MVIGDRAADHIGLCISTCTFGKHTHLFFLSIPKQRGCSQGRCLGLSKKDEEDMKTSRPVGAIFLAVLALTILRQLYHPTVNVKENVTVGNTSDSTIYEDTDGEEQPSDETNTRIGAELEEYRFHKGCPCQRTAPSLSQLERNFNASAVEQARRSSKPWNPAIGSYVGNSTCNRHSTLGCSERG